MKKKATILIVDDTLGNIKLLEKLLRSIYEIKIALNGKEALEIASDKEMPDLILLDVMMPEMDGYEVCRRLKAEPFTSPIPIIFLTANIDATAEEKGFKLGAIDYITKPYSGPVIKARIATHLALSNQNRTLELKVKERTEKLERSQLQVVQRLGRASEFKDNETGLHVIRMSHYSALLAKALGWSEEQADLLLAAAPMHDVGKIGIPDQILTKPAKLDEEEWKIMRTHPEIGSAIIGADDSPLMELARQVALTHHEKWDGSGYPAGLVGDQIPQSGRIVALADVFDALTTERPYKKAWEVDHAVDWIKEQSGKHFELEIVHFFLKILPEFLTIRDQYAEHLYQSRNVGEKSSLPQKTVETSGFWNNFRKSVLSI